MDDVIAVAPGGRRFRLAPEHRLMRVAQIVEGASGRVVDAWIEQQTGERYDAEMNEFVEIWEQAEEILP